MSPKRFFYVMIGVVSLLAVLAVTSVIVGNSMLTKKNNRLSELKLENKVLEEQKTDVAAAKISIQQYEELEQIAKQIVPQDKNQAKAVRELIKIAKTAGIQIAGISFPTSTLGGAAPSTSSGSSSPSSSSSSTKAPASQLIPVAGIPGLYQLDITLQTTSDSVDYPRLQSFLQQLEANRRTAHISNITITPNTINRAVLTVGMTLNIYVKP